MKNLKRKIDKQTIFFVLFFVFFFLSFTGNAWKVSPESFHTFERAPEALVIGKILKSQKDGIFSDGGLTGLTYTPDSLGKFPPHLQTKAQNEQHYIYLTGGEIPPNYNAYKSQTGGHAITYSILDQILHLSPLAKLRAFRFLNAALISLCFVLFLGWVTRNLGFTCALVAFILILLSPWINNFSHNLWWSFWSFYFPFLCVLLFLEKRHINPHKYSNLKLYIAVFISVFIKCFFSGFEFISTTLLAIVCPMVYYSYLEKEKIRSFIVKTLKAGITAILAVLAEMSILVFQLKALYGTFQEGINHIALSFHKRTTEETIADNLPSYTYKQVLEKYLGGNAFELGFLSGGDFIFPFGGLIIIILICCVAIFLKNKKQRNADSALLLTTAFSILCPLSWFIIFKQHSTEHPHLDYIVWYIPFMFFGFCCIGKFISLFFWSKTKSIQSGNNRR